MTPLNLITFYQHISALPQNLVEIDSSLLLSRLRNTNLILNFLLTIKTAGVNFINILHARFSYESLFGSFILVSNPKHSFVIFGTKILYETQARKILMKLTPGVNITNIFTQSFYVWRSQKRKKTVMSLVSFLLLRSSCVKSACKMLVKLTPNAQVVVVKAGISLT